MIISFFFYLGWLGQNIKSNLELLSKNQPLDRDSGGKEKKTRQRILRFLGLFGPNAILRFVLIPGIPRSFNHFLLGLFSHFPSRF